MKRSLARYLSTRRRYAYSSAVLAVLSVTALAYTPTEYRAYAHTLYRGLFCDPSPTQTCSIFFPFSTFPNASSSAYGHVVGTTSEQHDFRPDGLLTVNPNASHPIPVLIAHAEAQWAAKLARASRTLQDAVAEYGRRYGRAPPLGLDLWWNYVEAHNVSLPDEYDQIDADLAPFWALPPHELARLRDERGAQETTITFGKEGVRERVRVLDWALPPELELSFLGTFEHYNLELLRPIEHLLPPFRVVMQPHDTAVYLKDFEAREAMVDAGRWGEYIDPADLPHSTISGWLSACPPSSPARAVPINLTQPLPDPALQPQPKTFIHSAKPLTDPCAHPDLLRLSGRFLQNLPGPHATPIPAPQLTVSKTSLHADILVASLHAWREDTPGGAVGWGEKTEDRLLWRGRTTGMAYARGARWREGHRARFVRLTQEMGGVARVLRGADGGGPVGKGEEVGLGDLNVEMMDVSFVGEPIQCAEETCEEVGEMFFFQPAMYQSQEAQYKYIMDIDGNGWSSRFERLLLSNSLIFKATIYPEWFTDRIQPWVHYVPIQQDYSDLYDALTYFRGDLDAHDAHDAAAEKIASAGRAWVKKFWRKEDMTAYQFRLLLEYIRLMSPDREAMSYRL